MSAPSLCSALAMADSSTFLMITAAFFCVNVRMLRAWSTFLPRIRSATRRPLSTDRRTPRRTARVSDMFYSLLLGFFVRRVTLEGTGQREFAELVADHLVSHIHGHVLLAVVHGDGQTDELGQNHGATRPGLDGLLVLGGDGLFGLCQQVMVNKRTLFKRTSHLLPFTSCDATQSSTACACCYGYGSPSSGCPMGQQRDDLHRSCLQCAFIQAGRRGRRVLFGGAAWPMLSILYTSTTGRMACAPRGPP